MGLEDKLRSATEDALQRLVRQGALPADAVRAASFTIDRPKRAEHGDLATNVALALGKRAGKPPRELAELIAEALRAAPIVASVAHAGTELQHHIQAIIRCQLAVVGEVFKHLNHRTQHQNQRRCRLIGVDRHGRAKHRVRVHDGRQVCEVAPGQHVVPDGERSRHGGLEVAGG